MNLRLARCPCFYPRPHCDESVTGNRPTVRAGLIRQAALQMRARPDGVFFATGSSPVPKRHCWQGVKFGFSGSLSYLRRSPQFVAQRHTAQTGGILHTTHASGHQSSLNDQSRFGRKHPRPQADPQEEGGSEKIATARSVAGLDPVGNRDSQLSEAAEWKRPSCPYRKRHPDGGGAMNGGLGAVAAENARARCWSPAADAGHAAGR